MARVKGIGIFVMILLFIQLMVPHLGTLAVPTDEQNKTPATENENINTKQQHSDQPENPPKINNQDSTPKEDTSMNEPKNDPKDETVTPEDPKESNKEPDKTEEKQSNESDPPSEKSDDPTENVEDKNKPVEDTEEGKHSGENNNETDKGIEEDEQEESEPENSPLLNSGPGEYWTDATSRVIPITVDNSSTNNHTKLHKLWASGNVVYVAVSSTHKLQYMTLNGKNADDTDTYRALTNIRINGVQFDPTSGLKGNTKDAHWTIFKFNLASLNLTDGSNSFFVKGIGGGHDVGGNFTSDIPKTEVTANKKWVGGTDYPAITLQLMGQVNNGNKVVLQTGHIDGSETPEWTYTWDGIPKYDPYGRKYTFSADEENVPPQYKKTINQLTVTNTFTETEDKLTINIHKNWVGDTAESATFELFANGVKTDKTLVLTESNWSGQFSNLSVYDDSDEMIQYSVQEIPIPGYSTEMTGTVDDGFTFTNTFIDPNIETVNYDVKKKWVGPKAGPVTIKLLADGSETDKTIVLNEQNGWKGSFNHLKKYNALTGEHIIYSVKEIDAPSGYTVNYSKKNNKFIVTNTAYAYSLTVIKLGENNQRLADATFELRRSDGEIIETLTTGQDGTITFSDLEPGHYRLIETKAPYGYYKLTKEIPITIDSNSQNIMKNVHNTPMKWTLPDTGGSGTPVFYTVGIIVMALMLLIFTRQRA